VRDGWRRGHVAAAAAALVAVVVAFWLLADDAPENGDGNGGIPAVPDGDAWPTDGATYVGIARCGECHADALAAFRGSHHDRAIEEPTEETVLAPFDGRSFAHDDFVATFSRDGETYRVVTEGPDGAPSAYDVAYTFGVDPLQQYLLRLDDGRLQALTVAWDARREAEGGQRFFDLYPDERIAADDPLHWSGPMQNWNYVCADCHSTALKKGFDVESGSFETTWAELDVGCEACHGPGSAHVAWAEAGAEGLPGGLVVSLRRATPWVIADGAPSTEARRGDDNVTEIETCAPCHSRRDQLAEGRRPDEPYLDAYRPELISRRLYHHDGQIDGEVYVYGSFVQSRMFHAGVRCSDCHEPHSLSLRREGNALCTGCHAEDVYDTTEHHHHEGEGSGCVDCHMADKTYMEVDARRDHSLRLPRPDLAASLGVPDPCTRCHQDEGSTWAAERVAEWFGPQRRPHWATTLYAARRREADSAERLRTLAADRSAPAIVRGTALALLDDFPGPVANEALRDGARSSEPLVRLGATYGARELEPAARLALIRPLLADPLLAVRIEAARTLAIVPVEALSRQDAENLRAAVDELIETEKLHSDRADAWLRIGLVELDRQHPDAADRALRTALRVDPRFAPAMVNLADLRRIEGDEGEAEALLRRALTLDEDDAEALHALGLLLVRTARATEATPYFARAADMRGDNPRFRYVHAVALAELGDLAGAISALERGVDAHPRDPDMLMALAQYRAQVGDREGAREAAEQLLLVRPDDAQVQAFVRGLGP